jgi:hypothetical protein
VLGSQNDLAASASDPHNHDVFRELVDLEIESTFSFQAGRWLGDVAPDVLTQAQRDGLRAAKERAAVREAAEARIPRHLWYTQGWPTCIPTAAEAALLAEVRRTVAGAVGLEAACTDAAAIVQRYHELIEQKHKKNQAA